MTDAPTGALSTLRQVRDLVYAAKVEGKESTLYIVDPTRGSAPSFEKVKLTENAHLVGNTLFLGLSAPSKDHFVYQDNLLLPTFNVGSSGRARDRYIFPNYWLAWGYYQRAKQRHPHFDQSESNQELFGR